MQKTINNKNYSISVTLYWGSDSKDVNENTDSCLNNEQLNDNIVQLDIISTLAVPFFYGSFIYADSTTNSTLINLIDIPIIHGRIMVCMLDGSDVPGISTDPKPYGEEYFSENIVITGIESADTQSSSKVLVKFNFASEDILKFTANLEDVSTFDKDDGNKETDKVNEVIKNLFSKVDLSEKYDETKADANSDIEIKYINSSNDNLMSALEYIYRKIYDDNFSNAKECSYIRIRYNHTTRKYEQWKYSDVGTDKLIYLSGDAYEDEIRNVVNVNLGKSGETNISKGKFTLENSGSSLTPLENYENVKFIDYNYNDNEFTSSNHEKLDCMIMDHTSIFDTRLIKRAAVINENGDKFKDIKYMTEFTTSSQNGSIYDIITDTIFNSNYYRVESPVSIGRKAGDEIVVNFENPLMSMYETLRGDYLITAIDNRYVADDGGEPSFKSIMDVHRPFMYPDSTKREESY